MPEDSTLSRLSRSGDGMTVIAREAIIADAMHEIDQRLQEDGESLPEGYRREFAEAVVGRLADDYLGAVAETERLRALLTEALDDAIHDNPRKAWAWWSEWTVRVRRALAGGQ